MSAPALSSRLHNSRTRFARATLLTVCLAAVACGHAQEPAIDAGAPDTVTPDPRVPVNQPLGRITGPPLHPDGALGCPFLAAGIRYTSVYRQGVGSGMDFQAYRAAFGLVLHSRITLHAEYEFSHFDPGRHLLLGGFSIFTRNPVTATGSVNADGPIWAPVVTALGGARVFDHADSSSRPTADLRLILSVGPYLSIGGGYRWREEVTPDDAISGYGLINLYFATYPSDSAWANPDGPAGIPSLRLRGGAATHTWGVDLQLLAPLQADLTLTVAFGMERLFDPKRTAYLGNLGFILYFPN